MCFELHGNEEEDGNGKSGTVKRIIEREKNYMGK